MARPRWQPFDLRNGASALPRTPGLYALYNGAGALIYIGSTGNIRCRIVDHLRLKPGIAAAKVTFTSGVYKREQRLIRRLRPLLNLRITYRNQRDATR